MDTIEFLHNQMEIVSETTSNISICDLDTRQGGVPQTDEHKERWTDFGEKSF